MKFPPGKKILPLIFCLVALIGACSKNKRVNKRLEGRWVQVSQNGTNVDPDNAVRLVFEKSGNDNGTVTIVNYSTVLRNSDVFPGTYKITNKGTVLTIDVNGSFPATAGSQSSTVTYNMMGEIIKPGSAEQGARFTFSHVMTGTVSYSGGGGKTTSDNSVWVFEKL